MADSMSECQQCELNQKCDLAFDNSEPGIFCGHWTPPFNLTQLPIACCCPADYICNANIFSCRCYASTSSSLIAAQGEMLAWLVAGVIFLSLCLFATILSCIFGFYRCFCHPKYSVAVSINDDDGDHDGPKQVEDQGVGRLTQKNLADAKSSRHRQNQSLPST